MAQITIQKIVEGPSNIILRANLLSDGSGELVDQVLLSPNDLTPPRQANRTTFRIMQIWYQFVWFDVTLGFSGVGANTRPIWTLARDSQTHVDFRSFGGLADYDQVPPAVNYSGNLIINTNGFNVPNSQGSLVLDLKKTSL